MVDPYQDVIFSLLSKYDSPTLGIALARAAAGFGKKEDLEHDIRTLVQLADVINEKDSDPRFGRTALHLAVISNHKPAVELLLQLGARYDIEDANGNTVLCIENIDEETKMILLIKLARDLSEATLKKYRMVDDPFVRSVDQPFFLRYLEEAMQNESNIKLLMGFIHFVIVEQARCDLYVGKEIEAIESVRTRGQLEAQLLLYGHLVAYKEPLGRLSSTANFSSISCNYFIGELLKHKAFRDGKILMHMVLILGNEGAYKLVMINGTAEKITPCTMLCDVTRGEVYIGKQAHQYLQDFQVSRGYKINTLLNNAHPNFANIMYGRNGLYNLLTQIKAIILDECRSTIYQGNLVKYLQVVAYQFMTHNRDAVNDVFKVYHKLGVTNIEEKITSLVRDFKSCTFSTVAAMTIFPPVAQNPSTVGNNAAIIPKQSAGLRQIRKR
jgi:hypothetical protein